MKKKILLAILILVILLGAGGAYTYFATDLFKTEKEIFFSYMKDKEAWPDFEEEKMSEYVKKQTETPYTNKGEITIDMSEIEDESAEMLNNAKIKFEGKTNNAQKLLEQTFTLDFSQGFNIPINFKLDGDTFGIQTDLLDSKYIALRNANLKQLVEKFNIDSKEIPDKIEFKDIKFTDEEIKTLKNKYFDILDKNLDKDMFTKEKVDNQTVIKLTVPAEKVIEIMRQIIETLRDDEILLGKMSNIEEGLTEQYKEKINELLEEMKINNLKENDKIEFNLYTESKKINKLDIIVFAEGEAEVSMTIENSDNKMAIKTTEKNEMISEIVVSKEKSGNDVIYKLTAKTNGDEGENNIELTAQFKNLLILDNVEEIINVKIDSKYNDKGYDRYYENKEDMSISLNYSNNKTFTTNLEIDKINESNAIILNDATEEELQTLILNIYQKLGLI